MEEGFFIMVERDAPAIVHIHFHVKAGYMEFLNDVLGPECTLTNTDECNRYSTFMGMQIEAYTLGSKIIYFATDLFTADEAQRFVGYYNVENFSGLYATLQKRRKRRYEVYVDKKIATALDTDICQNNILEVDFSHDGPQTLLYLHAARMKYTAPLPGNFPPSNVHIDPLKPSILFHV